MITISLIVIGLIIGLPILAIVLIEQTVDKKEEAKSKIEEERIKAAAEARVKAKAKAEAEAKAKAEEAEALATGIAARNLLKGWWRNSRFNSFIVLEKRTPMHFNGKRYMAVRHVETNKCYNLDVDVTTYFNHDIGAELHVTDIKYDYITKEAFAEFTAETGVNIPLELLQGIWTMEEDILELLNDLKKARN